MTLLDGAPKMIAKAVATLGPRAKAAVVQDFADPLPAGPFDAIVSSLAIHHLDDAGKGALYARAHDALRPGGAFVNAEQVLGETPELDALFWRWHEREARSLGATDEEWSAAVQRMTHDRCATVSTNLEFCCAAPGSHRCRFTSRTGGSRCWRVGEAPDPRATGRSRTRRSRTVGKESDAAFGGTVRALPRC